MVAIGSWMDTEITHDWAGGDFLPSQCVEAIGLAFAITALITYTIANISPPQAAAIAATIQIARLFGNEVGNAVIQTFVRVREQAYSNLIGLHMIRGSSATAGIAAQLAGPFGNRQTGLSDPTVLAALVQHEAYVLPYIDAFWLIAWVSPLSILLVPILSAPPPSPLTPPRNLHGAGGRLLRQLQGSPGFADRPGEGTPVSFSGNGSRRLRVPSLNDSLAVRCNRSLGLRF
jgi:DHA2 family multidrug resistance protein